MQLGKPEPLAQHPPLPVAPTLTLEVGGGEVSDQTRTCARTQSRNQSLQSGMRQVIVQSCK